MGDVPGAAPLASRAEVAEELLAELVATADGSSGGDSGSSSDELVAAEASAGGGGEPGREAQGQELQDPEQRLWEERHRRQCEVLYRHAVADVIDALMQQVGGWAIHARGGWRLS